MKVITDKYYLYHSGDCLELRQTDNYTKLFFEAISKFTVRRFQYPSMRKMVDRALELLDEKQREVIRLRYGLADGNCLTFTAIGERIGLSTERIRAIKERALIKMAGVLNTLIKTKVEDYIHVHAIGVDAIESIFIDDLCNLFLERETTLIAPIFKRSGISVGFHFRQIQKSIYPNQTTETKSGDSIMVRQRKLEELNLSIRTYNCLAHAGIKTVGDVIDTPDEELQKIRNLGKRSYEELKRVMKAVFTIDITAKDSSYYSLIDIECNIRGERKTRTVCFDSDCADMNVLVNIVYELICDKDNMGANVFDSTLSMQTKNYLLLKGYFYLSDVIENAHKIADEFEKVDLADCAAEVRDLAEGLASAIMAVDSNIFSIIRKYDIRTFKQLEFMPLDTLPTQDSEAILGLRKWCSYNIMFAVNTVKGSVNTISIA